MLRRSWKLAATAAVGALAVTLLAACGSGSEQTNASGFTEIKLNYTTPLPKTAAVEGMRTSFSDKLADATDGAVEVNPYYSDSLLPATDMLKGMQDGRVDMGYVCASYFPEQLPLYQITGLPWLTDNAEAVVGALDKMSKENDAFAAEFEKQGVKPLFFVPIQNAVMVGKEPLTSVDQFKGMRARSYSFPAEMIENAGGEPVFLSYAEVYEAMSRGTIDAVFPSTTDNALDVSLTEVAKQFDDLGAGQFVSCFVGLSTKAWDKMSPETQDEVTKLADAATPENLDAFVGLEDKTCDRLKEAGGTLSKVDQSVVDEWKEMSGYDSFEGDWAAAAEKAGVEKDAADSFLTDYKASIADLSASNDYVSGLTRCMEG
ncbi:hypothetical protein ASC77_19670 [Nocardioides sp. Root1257]|nr:hypothetical protein ASC77_19670 [Nocardioides sp. Root1257]KRC45991.1 hypothetical protein ASE24_15550 [Nocardioides sp. Root224]